MSQPWQQQPDGGYGQQPQQPGGFGQQPNPYGQPQPPQQPYGQPPQQGYGYPPAQPQPPGQPQPWGAPGGGFPPPPPGGGPPTNVALAILAAVGAALVMGFLYAFIYDAMFDENTGEVRQISYVALAIGAAVGVGPAFLARNNWGVYILGGVLALAAAIFGELYGTAMILAEYSGTDWSAFKIFTVEFSNLWDLWQETNEAINWIFLLLAPAAAIGITQAVARRVR
ncbi:hypothetical protein [Streptomyces radicis]|uniref:Uncharacterized protein n=1 Tax=Streptomyces radicis TaxID=1750517 RepID=A0A3A9VW89_9ACTN|nr:hypothetical protein [Streptomyces radicis]RKN05188.1 hypothetical protein D7319_25775 [Streptomyces radicis]RKN16721.1 hypothetical protein D7318_25140 [Streptomyces radicis]